MPIIIRRALYQKFRKLPEMSQFQQDFEHLVGMKLAFVDELGLGDDLRHEESPMCHAIQTSEQGRSMCARSRHALLSEVEDKPGCMVCDAGLMEWVVPLNIGGMRAGYFIFGGIRRASSGTPALRKAAHLLRKNGIPFDDVRLKQEYLGTREIPLPVLEACQRLVELFARQIALKLTDHLGEQDASIPPMVHKAWRFIRGKALLEDIDLVAVARHCGVSAGHLSRLFHHSTGLTFREYLAQVRVENARELLLRTRRNVSEVAYDSGFQSLSQFHRVFLKVYGVPPGKVRTPASKSGTSPVRAGIRAKKRGRHSRSTGRESSSA
jgi:AraC-like DNA-binding protein